MQGFASNQEIHYRARVSGIGDVEIRTADRLPLAEPRKLIFVHPWVRELRDPLDGFTWGSTVEDDVKSDAESESCSAPTSPSFSLPTAAMDEYTRAMRLIVRLQQPFHALLLQQQPNGEFKRVAAEHEIVVPGIKRLHNFARDVRAEVVEIL
ncbi:hypothetical protein L210DRAFT_3568341 [Boletus edulis BED1]|uniref:Uncharacterized protein n=1 Tax=Boletus edulis BED1 TaxID=1328754 RepID=A0AAD4BEB2_BOLED|nr:hypothetical protein L210DRAFT_3568341 [Boletus edulis BED1]